MRGESPWIGMKFSEETLSLLLRSVDFLDEAIYKCSAITPSRRCESTVRLIVEGEGWINLVLSSVSVHKDKL